MRAGCSGSGSGLGCPHKRCPCTPPEGTDLADWNGHHGKRWNRLLTSIKRAYPSFLFMRGCEVQDGKRRDDGRGRGALHDHCIAWTEEPMDERLLRRLAVRAGFGHSVDLERVAPSSTQAADYVSKYVAKAVDERGEVPWFRYRRAKPALEVPGLLWDDEGGYVVRLGDEEGEDWTAWTPVQPASEARFRSWSKSQSWGSTMTQLRADGVEYARKMEAAREAAAAAAAAVAVVEDLVPFVLRDPVGPMLALWAAPWRPDPPEPRPD
jgi:hypothetical protein